MTSLAETANPANATKARVQIEICIPTTLTRTEGGVASLRVPNLLQCRRTTPRGLRLHSVAPFLQLVHIWHTALSALISSSTIWYVVPLLATPTCPLPRLPC